MGTTAKREDVTRDTSMKTRVTIIICFCAFNNARTTLALPRVIYSILLARGFVIFDANVCTVLITRCYLRESRSIFFYYLIKKVAYARNGM